MKRFASVDQVLRRLALADALDLALVVCGNHGVTREQLASRMRTKRVADCRADVWRALRNHPERRFTYVQIAWMFGRDHSTIVNTINPVTKAKNVERARERWAAYKASRATYLAAPSIASAIVAGVRRAMQEAV